MTTSKNSRRSKSKAPKGGVVYQFKITLLGIKPLIWRRIQIPDGTIDDLHEAIQTAMGWTNSHLHEFTIDAKRCGDPELLGGGWGGNADLINSRITSIGELFGGERPPSKIDYEYDFGDRWQHTIEWEGVVEADAKAKYPCCIDGARACPPEDISGDSGYANFLKAIKNPKHPEHDEYVEWIGGAFDPEAFDVAKATKAMRKGLPDW